MEDTDLLSEHKGKWTTPLALMMSLKRAGMNIFPAEYSSKYVSINTKVSCFQSLIAKMQSVAFSRTGTKFSWLRSSGGGDRRVKGNYYNSIWALN